MNETYRKILDEIKNASYLGERQCNVEIPFAPYDAIFDNSVIMLRSIGFRVDYVLTINGTQLIIDWP